MRRKDDGYSLVKYKRATQMIDLGKSNLEIKTEVGLTWYQMEQIRYFYKRYVQQKRKQKESEFESCYDNASLLA